MEGFRTMKKVLIIAGPTASGKTALSVKLAKYFNGEIISGDSQQVYQELSIGTAKITEQEKSDIKHYGIDLIHYSENYNVKDFQTMARQAIDEISNKDKLPIIAGGTGFYLKACLYDYEFNDELEEDNPFDELSNEELYTKLKEIDPQSLEKIHINNRKRLIRALNIGLKGQTKTERESIQNHQPIYDTFLVVLDLPKPLLDERIEKRLDTMFNTGLKEEVLTYFKSPETWAYQSFQGIGYKEWKEYLLNQMSLDEVKEKIIISTRQYAKRQLTWFRHQFKAYWYKPSEENEKLLIEDIEKWLTKETL
jgi:tRNA dimethylallyltransferase